jgi:alanine racemase
MHSSQAVIYLSNLKYNLLQIRKKIGRRKFMAVVKADAYGHGAVEVVKYLNTLGANKPDFYAVSFPSEALELRKNGIKSKIFVFDPFEKENSYLCIRYKLIATVFSKKHVKILETAFRNSPGDKNKIKVHIKVDTGMNRLGINYDKAYDFIKYVSQKKEFIIDGIYTHFAEADSSNKSFTLLQLKRFNDLISKLRAERIKFGLLHAANSAAVLDLQETYLNMVRCGISLYGYYPSLETSESIKLKPVMSVKSVVTTVKEINKGETVSYGRKFRAKKKTKIISVPVGYADGYRRGLTNRVRAIVNQKVVKQVGTITMDRTMFDVGKANIKVGDRVILLGREKNKSITAWDLAKTINTIPYEITCGITKRLPRVYTYGYS